MSLPVFSATNNSTLARKLGLSIAHFQAGAAQLMYAEGEVVTAMATAISSGHLTNKTAITNTNNQIKSLLVSLSNLQSQIISNIALATAVYNHWT